MRADIITKEQLLATVKKRMDGLLRANLYEMNLRKEQLEFLAEQKKQMKRDLKACALGNSTAKEAVCDFFLKSLEQDYGPELLISDRIWYFCRENLCESVYEFEQLLFRFRQQYGKMGLLQLFSQIREMQKENLHMISAQIIHDVYRKLDICLDEAEKKQLLVQKLYQCSYGLEQIDMLCEMALDGISCGVSSRQKDGYCVWIILQGNVYCLEFLCMGEKQLHRVCRLLASDCQQGQLSEERGYVMGERSRHERIIVTRPPFSEDWSFFIRKFDSIENKTLEQLIQGENAKQVVSLMRWLIRGNQVVAITGMQGCGKTTLLMALIGCIYEAYTLRVLEQVFELHLRELYPDRNIVTLRETTGISGQEGLDLLKKTDGNVTIIGEVASSKVAAWMIEAGQIGSLFTLFTHHAKTTKSLVYGIRNCLLQEGIFSNEQIALQQVVEVIRFNIRLHKDRTGRRYVQQISEIIPQENGFLENILLEYEDGGYMVRNPISGETQKDMKQWMSKEEQEVFCAELSL